MVSGIVVHDTSQSRGRFFKVEWSNRSWPTIAYILPVFQGTFAWMISVERSTLATVIRYRCRSEDSQALYYLRLYCSHLNPGYRRTTRPISRKQGARPARSFVLCGSVLVSTSRLSRENENTKSSTSGRYGGGSGLTARASFSFSLVKQGRSCPIAVTDRHSNIRKARLKQNTLAHSECFWCHCLSLE